MSYRANRIKGEIVVAQEVATFNGGVAHIYIEAVDALDTGSHLIAERRFERIAHQTGVTTVVPFEFEVPAAQTGRLSVQVWIDTEVNGAERKPEDLFNDCSHELQLIERNDGFIHIKVR